MSKQTIHLFRKTAISLAKNNLTYFVHSYSEEKSGFHLDEKLSSIRFEKGKLHIGDITVAKLQYGPHSLSWKQKTKNSFTMGHLHFSPNGLECQGPITVEKEGEDTHFLHVIATALPPSQYSTQISKKRYPKGTDPNSIPAEEWVVGNSFQLGYDYKAGDPVPTSVAYMDQQDISSYIGLSIVENDELRLSLNLDGSAVCDFDSNLYLQGEITFSRFGETFLGELLSICNDRSGNGVYLWKGEVAESHKTMLFSTANPQMPEIDELLEDTSLSVAELLTLIPDSDVMKLSNSMLVENMKWAIGQDEKEKQWLPDLFAQTVPVLSTKRSDLISQDLDWYQQKFSKAYLSKGLDSIKGKNQPTPQLDKEQLEKLDNYLKVGLGKSEAYNKQMNGIYLEAYISVRPRLRTYINDGGEKWAEKFFQAITTPAQINLIVNRVLTSHEMTPASNFAAVLRALQPNGDFAEHYQRMIMSRILMQYSSKTTIKDEKWTMEWMPEALKAFVDKYSSATGEHKEIADALEQAEQQFENWTSLAQEFTSLMIEIKGKSIIQQSESAAAAFSRKYPKLAKAAKGLYFIAWVGGVFGVISSFLGWKDLSTEEKISTIAGSVGLVGTISEMVMGIFSERITFDIWKKINQAVSEGAVLDETTLLLAKTDETYLQKALDAMDGVFDKETKTIIAKGTRWQKIFSGASKVIAVIGVVITAVVTVISTITFINDIKKGRVTKAVLDGIMMVSNFAILVCSVVQLFVESVVAAFASAIFSIIGLVITIIGLFIPEPKEPTPADNFMKDVAIPFVNGLPDPEEPTKSIPGNVQLAY
ncbi:MAG: hypothetical protein AAF518_13755 [Spirochaetota bacterium]